MVRIKQKQGFKSLNMALKTKVIKLIHKTLGLISEEPVTGKHSERYIIQEWKYRYGKKFLECEMVNEIDGEPIGSFQRKIVNEKTGEVYINRLHAAQSLKIGLSTVQAHVTRKYNKNFDYLVRYE